MNQQESAPISTQTPAARNVGSIPITRSPSQNATPAGKPGKNTDLHTQLIELSAKWLAVKHAVVITDMSHGLGETADAIGWTCGFSTLVECKASRADFLGDKHKPWRRDPSRGMGNFRYYATPAGMVAPTELPENWGLLEMHRGKLKVIVKARQQKRGASAETSLLVSALRRVAHTCPEGMAVRCYTIQSTKARATLGVREIEPLPITRA